MWWKRSGAMCSLISIEVDDTFDGQPIRVRFLWFPGATPRWEQAFSVDDGVTWETNWTMDFVREAPP